MPENFVVNVSGYRAAIWQTASSHTQLPISLSKRDVPEAAVMSGFPCHEIPYFWYQFVAPIGNNHFINFSQAFWKDENILKQGGIMKKPIFYYYQQLPSRGDLWIFTRTFAFYTVRAFDWWSSSSGTCETTKRCFLWGRTLWICIQQATRLGFALHIPLWTGHAVQKGGTKCHCVKEHTLLCTEFQMRTDFGFSRLLLAVFWFLYERRFIKLYNFECR